MKLFTVCLLFACVSLSLATTTEEDSTATDASTADPGTGTTDASTAAPTTASGGDNGGASFLQASTLLGVVSFTLAALLKN